jgi:hypothetical protein
MTKNYDDLLNRLARLEATLTAQGQSISESEDEERGINFPWSKTKHSGEIAFANDTHPGYEIPKCATPYLTRGRSDFELRKDQAKQLSRKYPVPAGGIIGEHSKVDSFVADTYKAAKYQINGRQIIAQRDKLQASNDLQARIIIPALHVLYELRRIYNPEGFNTDHPGDGTSEGTDDEQPTTSPESGRLRGSLDHLATMLRDLLIANRSAGNYIESMARENIASAITMPSTVKSELGKVPSKDHRQLFEADVEDRVEKAQKTEERNTLIRIAGNANNTKRFGGGNESTTKPTFKRGVSKRGGFQGYHGQHRSYNSSNTGFGNNSGTSKPGFRGGPSPSIPRASE